MIIPGRLRTSCSHDPVRQAWLEQLPSCIAELVHRWRLTVGAPFDGSEISCSWVAPALRADGTPAVLKLGMPHMEGEQEIQGLQFWNGDPTVTLFEADEQLNAMLLERCESGSMLRTLPEPEQDVVIAPLLRRLWRIPPHPHPFRHLSELTSCWRHETTERVQHWPDTGLVMEGLRLLEELPRTSNSEVLLATDLHAGNVLRAQRASWRIIDPKPFIGDPAYDATQHLINCDWRLRSAPRDTIHRFADLLGVDHERVLLWMFARAAAEPRSVWDADSVALARGLASLC